jgi:predicted GTPase
LIPPAYTIVKIPLKFWVSKKSKEIIHRANLVLFVCDISNQISKEDEDIFKIIQDKRKIIVLIN